MRATTRHLSLHCSVVAWLIQDWVSGHETCRDARDVSSCDSFLFYSDVFHDFGLQGIPHSSAMHSFPYSPSPDSKPLRVEKEQSQLHQIDQVAFQGHGASGILFKVPCILAILRRTVSECSLTAEHRQSTLPWDPCICGTRISSVILTLGAKSAFPCPNP